MTDRNSLYVVGTSRPLSLSRVLFTTMPQGFIASGTRSSSPFTVQQDSTSGCTALRLMSSLDRSRHQSPT